MVELLRTNDLVLISAIRALLGEDEIRVFIADEHMVGTAWHYAIALGGAKLKVPIDCVKQAGRNCRSSMKK